MGMLNGTAIGRYCGSQIKAPLATPTMSLGVQFGGCAFQQQTSRNRRQCLQTHKHPARWVCGAGSSILVVAVQKAEQTLKPPSEYGHLLDILADMVGIAGLRCGVVALKSVTSITAWGTR
jgi:hypothetical protein